MSKRRRTTRGSSEDEQVFLEALEADRSKPEILLGLAEVLFQQKRYRGAQGILRQALAIERAAPDLQARIQEVRDRIQKEATNDPVLSVILVAEGACHLPTVFAIEGISLVVVSEALQHEWIVVFEHLVLQVCEE